MIYVESGLYIGTAADLNDKEGLASAAVTHILSVDSEEPVLPTGAFHRKFIPVFDDRTSDLLSHMDDCFMFIQEAMEAMCSALVHCQAGRSRSATIVTAYLMKRHRLSMEEAYMRLQQLKADVEVNPGFQEQLCLYKCLQWEVDTSSPLYKQYRLQKVSEKYPELRDVPRKVFAADPAQSRCSEISYRCRKCRRTLFLASSLLSHPMGSGAVAFSQKKSSDLTNQSAGQNVCTSYFIEPVQWMEHALLGEMDGPLLCPKCSSKLGSFSWYGQQCSCGHWVTPSFQLHRSRLDQITHFHTHPPHT